MAQRAPGIQAPFNLLFHHPQLLPSTSYYKMAAPTPAIIPKVWPQEDKKEQERGMPPSLVMLPKSYTNVFHLFKLPYQTERDTWSFYFVQQ